MADLTCGFETGVNGNNVLTTDAGDATAWNVRTVGAGGAITYDTAHPAFGTLGAKFVTNGTLSHYIGWSTAFGTQTNHYGRMYLYLTAAPASAFPIWQVNSAGTTRAARIDINVARTLRILDAPASGIQSGSVAISLNQLVRIEWRVIHSTTVGQMELKLFNTHTSTTPSETITGPATWNTAASGVSVTYGAPATGGGFTYWFDAAASFTSGYPGPFLVVPANTVAPVASGTVTVGQTLSVTDGTWTGSPLPLTYTYQWQRDNLGGGVYANIGGATANTYLLDVADVGCNVRAVVTGTNSAGATSANSNALGPVPALPSAGGRRRSGLLVVASEDEDILVR